VIAVRRMRSRRDESSPDLGTPATWPPLRPSEPPVAAVGSLVSDEPPTSTAERAGGDEPVATSTAERAGGDEPVAAVGSLVTDLADRVGTDEPIEGSDVDALGETGPPSGASWVESVEGSCPPTHPIKANSNSGIFHQPGGRFYDRTQAERCYIDAASAEADGYRPAKGA